MRFEHVQAAVFGEPWAILPAKLSAIAELVRFRASGQHYTAEEIQARIGAAPVRPVARQSGNVAVLPLFGVVRQRMNMMTEMSGGTSTEQFAAAFRQAVADPNVKAVVIQIDSPGGGVFGVPELADEIYKARGQKPIIAVADSMAASAAYWIASAADEIVVTPGGEVGSIGVWTAHQDVSAALEMEGVKITLVSAGKYKVEANSFAPLTEEARAALQESVDGVYTAFVAAVARGRGARASEVRAGFGQGRMVPAAEAVRLGMADRIGTMADTLRRLGVGPDAGRSGMGAEDDAPELLAETTEAVPVGDGTQTIDVTYTVGGETKAAKITLRVGGRALGAAASAAILRDGADLARVGAADQATEPEAAEFNDTDLRRRRLRRHAALAGQRLG